MIFLPLISHHVPKIIKNKGYIEQNHENAHESKSALKQSVYCYVSYLKKQATAKY
ncbi:MAG: hypothetical protein UY44_C0015G0026, partial [Candidatus Kaiserbacteria bacterium GW2011_GWA2_49_19]